MKINTRSGIEVVITGLTRNFWKFRPFRPLKMSAAQGFARVRISQFHIVLACFSCILPEQGLHLRYTESCPRGRRCDTRNFWKFRPFRPLKMSAAQGFARVRISQFHIVLACFSCILPEQGLHLRYTESCPRGRRCDTRNVVFPKGT